MSNSVKRRVNHGAYASPFSGVGLESLPLGTALGHSGLVLHESGFLPRNCDWNFPNVFSQFWRLYYDFATGHQVVFPNKTVALGPDRLVLVPSGCRFDCCGDAPVPTFWLHFSSARRPVPEQVVPIELTPTPVEAACLAEIVPLFAANQDGRVNDRIFGFSLALLHLVLNREALRWMESAPAGIEHAVQHIKENFSSALRIPALARVAGMSVRGFMRTFRRHYSIAPGKFITQVRVGEAAHLLLSTGESLEQIAEKTGFRDRAYFTRVFKRLTQEAPAEFRRKHKAGPSAISH